MFKTIKKVFIFSGALVFLMTGLAKVVSALGSAEVLTMPDPVTHVSFSKLMLFGGLLEMVIAVTCIFYRSGILPVALMAWMTTTLAAYRVGLWLKNWHEPCKCLGSLTGGIHIPTYLADGILKSILICFLIASYTILSLESFGFRPSEKNKIAEISGFSNVVKAN